MYTRIEIKRLIEEGEWDTKEFAEMREKLLKVLDIKHNPIDNEVMLKKLERLEEQNIEFEKLLKEIRAK
uniref:Uncharacterized protein n=1 Tax=Rhizophagus irregularis (strain DAOM 181602 / DAOM 197198 / MUCL 43194) TaxID=747089 RepID=U9UNK2_RHIID